MLISSLNTLTTFNLERIQEIIEAEVAIYVKSDEFKSMLESVKRKERESAVAAVKIEVLNEKRYVTQYGYSSELLSMDHHENDEDMTIYGTNSTSSSGIRKDIGNNVTRGNKVDPFFEMNHDTWGEVDSRVAPSSSVPSINYANDRKEAYMKQPMIVNDTKLQSDERRLEEIRLRKLQQEEEAQKRRDLEEEERKRKKEEHEEQMAILSNRKTKLSFSLGKKRSF